jgi:hypothetical protein
MSKNARRPADCLADINTAFWKIDSPNVWKIAMRNGLDEWIAKHPDFDTRYSGNRFELMSSTEDEPYWLVSCSAKSRAGKRKRDRMEIGISARDGRLLYKKESP